jgi:hypothetical protein
VRIQRAVTTCRHLETGIHVNIVASGLGMWRVSASTQGWPRDNADRHRHEYDCAHRVYALSVAAAWAPAESGCANTARSHLTMQSILRGAIAFAELLSCGFATIGVRTTLVAVGGQLLDDAAGAVSRGLLSFATQG